MYGVEQAQSAFVIRGSAVQVRVGAPHSVNLSLKILSLFWLYNTLPTAVPTFK